MHILITRHRYKPATIDGQLSIDGIRICDCAENAHTALPPGTYPIAIVHCRQYARKMPILSPVINNQSSVISICSSCPRKHYVNHNTVMPCFCPMIKPGNGIHSRHDGSILIGHRQCQGLLIHPREVFTSIYDRLRMTIQRGNEVTLKIINA